MQLSGTALASKEYEVVSTGKALENKQLALRSAEDAALFQRISAAAAQREAERYRSKNTSTTSRFGREPLPTRGGDSRNRTPAARFPPHPSMTHVSNDHDKDIENELRLIQRSIRSSKHSSNSTSSARVATFGFLSDEVKYISNNSNIARESYY